jgi:hypothetical protein
MGPSSKDYQTRLSEAVRSLTLACPLHFTEIVDELDLDERFDERKQTLPKSIEWGVKIVQVKGLS